MEDKKRRQKNTSGKAYLEWKKEDFVKQNEEIPDSLVFDDFHTEGELMSDEEIANWVLDTQKTFSIIKQNNPDAFDDLYNEYGKDLKYLVKIKRIDEKTLDDLLDKNNFEF